MRLSAVPVGGRGVAGSLRGAVAAIAVAAAGLAWLGAPTSALACTAPRCMDPFGQWLGGSPVAVYELDRSASWWVPAPRRQPGAEPWNIMDDRCIFRGVFTFRRVEAIRGATPSTITTRVARGVGDCPGWDMRGSWVPGVMRSPSGRWIVALDADAVADAHFVAFYHLDSASRIDNDGSYPGDYPETLPATVDGWRAALGMPATDAAPSASITGTTSSFTGPLLAAAAVGLAAGLWRSRRPRRSREPRADP